MHEKAEMELLSLLEAFDTKTAQLRRAVFLGDDALVAILDREIEPLIHAIVDHRAETSAGIRRQLGFVNTLIREEAEDRASVLRHANALSTLIDRYHAEEDGAHASAAAGVPNAIAPGRLFSDMLLDSLSERVAVLTCDCRVLYANRAYAKPFRCKPVELVGCHIAEIVGEECFESGLRDDLALCFRGEERCFRYTVSKNGGLLVIGRTTPLRGEGDGILGALLVVNETRSLAS